jgi:hypothetical protein
MKKSLTETQLRNMIREEMEDNLQEELDPGLQQKFAQALEADKNVVARLASAMSAIEGVISAAAWVAAHDMREPQNAYVAVGAIRNTLADEIDARAKAYLKQNKDKLKQIAAQSATDEEKRKADRRSGVDRRPDVDDEVIPGRRIPGSDKRS